MGMKSPAKKKEIVKRSRPTDAELGKIDSNNGDAGKIISDLTAGHKSIEYEARDIALYDIRVNADNEIFRQADTQEDIVQLAEDIQRNGLMHNLVVFPQEETPIPEDFDCAPLTGLRLEAREKLAKIRPRSVGQAARIPGVGPADVACLAVELAKRRRSEGKE